MKEDKIKMHLKENQRMGLLNDKSSNMPISDYIDDSSDM